MVKKQRDFSCTNHTAQTAAGDKEKEFPLTLEVIIGSY